MKILSFEDPGIRDIWEVDGGNSRDPGIDLFNPTSLLDVSNFRTVFSTQLPISKRSEHNLFSLGRR